MSNIELPYMAYKLARNRSKCQTYNYKRVKSTPSNLTWASIRRRASDKIRLHWEWFFIYRLADRESSDFDGGTLLIIEILQFNNQYIIAFITLNEVFCLDSHKL